MLCLTLPAQRAGKYEILKGKALERGAGPVSYTHLDVYKRQDVLAADNEWQDAYLYGVTTPVEWFEGEVIAVVHRLNDVEDKWVVAAPGTRATELEIRRAVDFQERFFETEIEVLR